MLPGAEAGMNQSVPRFGREDAMSHQEYVERIALFKREKKGWSPTVKMVLAFVLGFLALSPAILGIHWERLLP